MSYKKPYYKEIIVDNFIADFGMNVDFLSDNELLEQKIKHYSNFPNYKDGLKTILNECLKAINNQYPIENWFLFVDSGLHEVNPETPHDLETDEGAYLWFCDAVRLFADVLFEHKIITKEERDEAFKEVSFKKDK